MGMIVDWTTRGRRKKRWHTTHLCRSNQAQPACRSPHSPTDDTEASGIQHLKQGQIFHDVRRYSRILANHACRRKPGIHDLYNAMGAFQISPWTDGFSIDR